MGAGINVSEVQRGPSGIRLPGWVSCLCLWCNPVLFVTVSLLKACCVLGDSGGVVNFLNICPASLKSLGCLYFQCMLSSQWKAVTVNLRILHCQL